MCLLVFTESWLKEQDTSADLEIDGFGAPFRVDRDPVVRESLCSPHIELLSVSVQPFYLPREFPQIFVTVVYIHPKADVDIATRAISNTVNRLQAIAPDAPNLVMGDFNHCKPGKTLALNSM